MMVPCSARTASLSSVSVRFRARSRSRLDETSVSMPSRVSVFCCSRSSCGSAIHHALFKLLRQPLGLGEETAVLDGDHGLVGQGGEETQVFTGVGVGLVAAGGEHSHDLLPTVIGTAIPERGCGESTREAPSRSDGLGLLQQQRAPPTRSGGFRVPFRAVTRRPARR